MRIVLPVHHFPPRYSAGAELYTLRLARWLQDHGHHVEVVCIEAIDQGGPDQLRAVEDCYEGIVVWRLHFNLAHVANRRWSYDNPLLGAWFANYLRRAQPDLVHFQAGYLIGVAPLIAASAAGVPTVLTLHDFWFVCPRITLQRGDGTLCTEVPANPADCAWCVRLESRRYRLPDRWTGGGLGKAAIKLDLIADMPVFADRRARLLAALALPGAVIAPSRFLGDQFAPYVAPERLHISRYGLDLTKFQDQRRPTPDGMLRIGYTGQVVPHKGVHLLVEAFRVLRPRDQACELHIYGGLDARPDYVAHLRHLAGGDARIQFHGRFENGRVATILAGLDAAVVPSVWYENSPLAIMEAHAAGTPVITANLGGMSELVRDGVDGLHFDPHSAADLARQLQRLLDEPALLPRLRSGIVAPRGIDDEMRQISQIYRDLRAQPAPALGDVAG